MSGNEDRLFPNARPEIDALDNLVCRVETLLPFHVHNRDEEQILIVVDGNTFLSIGPNMLASDPEWTVEISTAVDALPHQPAEIAERLAKLLRQIADVMDAAAEIAR